MDLIDTGAKFAEKRKHLGLTQARLGEILGLSVGTIRNIERGEYVQPKYRFAIEHLLGGRTLDAVLSAHPPRSYDPAVPYVPAAPSGASPVAPLPPAEHAAPPAPPSAPAVAPSDAAADLLAAYNRIVESAALLYRAAKAAVQRPAPGGRGVARYAPMTGEDLATRRAEAAVLAPRIAARLRRKMELEDLYKRLVAAAPPDVPSVIRSVSRGDETPPHIRAYLGNLRASAPHPPTDAEIDAV